jgi:carbon-monoxide dehydrogenase large subunit
VNQSNSKEERLFGMLAYAKYQIEKNRWLSKIPNPTVEQSAAFYAHYDDHRLDELVQNVQVIVLAYADEYAKEQLNKELDRYKKEVLSVELKKIKVGYEVLPHVLDARSAMKAGAPIVHDTIPDNICQYVSWGNKQKTQEAIDNAEVVVTKHLPYQLVSASPVETRSTIADYDPTTEDYTLWTNTQIPHINRAALCGLVLGIPFNKLRVIVPEVGGSYGCKGYIYNDTGIALVMARRLGRPVKWVDTREGIYRRTVHARGSDVDATIAGDKKGKITALHCKNYATLGAYSTFNGPGAPALLSA